MGSFVPIIDEGVRRRLRSRFGDAIDSWLDGVPAVLAALSQRWELELGPLIPHGSMSVVVRCRTAERGAAVLKLTPDRARLAREAAALSAWATPHVPTVYEFDAGLSALLTEAIEPGGMLRDAAAYPSIDSLAGLVGSLHRSGAGAGGFPPVAHHVTYLFDSWDRQRRLHPELAELVPEPLFERGRRFASRLAAQPPSTVLLHGDLTAVNVLDGGGLRGLVAIDPAACLGDPAYDAIDLLVWRADDIATVQARATQLATDIDLDVTRVLDWCLAFAAMFALDLVGTSDDWRDRAAPFLALASEVPRQ